MALPSGEYCMYLRKSRADMEAEARGEGETLTKHRRILYALAKRYNINVTKIYQEIVSGDRILDRPEAQKLLSDVEDGTWAGVLVVEVERLARGDTIDQGLVAQAFKNSSTLIITPVKTYDPNNEFDEEYFEFGLFMARREFKTIKRRLIRGREESVREGNYIGTRPPYGYQLAWNEHHERYLEPDPEQADVVRMIFDWYVNGIEEDGQIVEMGSTKIARKLDEMGIPTYRKTSRWSHNVVLQMLRNEVYIGRIQWKKIQRQKTSQANKMKYVSNEKEDWIDVQGKHEPLIDQETFEKARVKMTENLNNPLAGTHKIVNPLAGLIICGKCGRSMVLKPYRRRKDGSRPYLLQCNNKYCDCKGSRFEYVEERIIAAMQEWLKQYKLALGKRKKSDSGVQVRERLIKSLRTELEQLKEQQTNLYDLLERKIYTEEIFLERSKNIAKRIAETGERLKEAEKELEDEQKREHTQKDIVPSIQETLRLYKRSKDQQRKNTLMKQILVKAVYRKEKHQTNDEFEIRITPRLPRV